jgi:hypothetical protein
VFFFPIPHIFPYGLVCSGSQYPRSLLLAVLNDTLVKGRQADAEYFRKDYPSSEKNDDINFDHDLAFSFIFALLRVRE